MPVVARQHDAVGADDVERAGVGFAADARQLAVEFTQARGVAWGGERVAHIRIERQHDRQMILPADLGRDRVGDELDALLVDRLQRSQPVLAPNVLRCKGRHADGGDSADK